MSQARRDGGADGLEEVVSATARAKYVREEGTTQRATRAFRAITLTSSSALRTAYYDEPGVREVQLAPFRGLCVWGGREAWLR